LEDNFDDAEEELIRILKIISTRYLWGHFIIYNILSVCIFKYNEILFGVLESSRPDDLTLIIDLMIRFDDVINLF